MQLNLESRDLDVLSLAVCKEQQHLYERIKNPHSKDALTDLVQKVQALGRVEAALDEVRLGISNK